MSQHPTNPDAKSLEDAFFARQNAELLEAMRKKAARAERLEALRHVMPRADETLLNRLLDLGISGQTVLALMLLPLARVAWADGSIDAKERAAILKAAEEREMRPGTASHELLKTWLDQRPSDSIVATWKGYVGSVWSHLEPAEQAAMRQRLLDMARGVAEAAGGILGLGPKVSPAERAVLEDIEASLR